MNADETDGLRAGALHVISASVSTHKSFKMNIFKEHTYISSCVITGGKLCVYIMFIQNELENTDMNPYGPDNCCSCQKRIKTQRTTFQMTVNMDKKAIFCTHVLFSVHIWNLTAVTVTCWSCLLHFPLTDRLSDDCIHLETSNQNGLKIKVNPLNGTVCKWDQTFQVCVRRKGTQTTKSS